MGFYGPFARALCLGIRAGLPGWKVHGSPESGPAVYVVHHQNLYGPLHTIPLFPGELHLWVLHVFFTRRECFNQYYSYTFTQRFGWPKAPAFLAAGLLSLVFPSVLRSIEAVPVYRGSGKIRETLELSLDVLCRGESILICPDRDYASGGDETKEIYSGFFQLERGYFRRTGKHLPFVPLRCHGGRKTLMVGKPVVFQGGSGFRQKKEEMAAVLTEQMNTLGEV